MTERCELPLFNLNQDQIREILLESRTVAVVGLSANPLRDSHRVASFLQAQGYKIVPVNPKYDSVLGERCYPSLLDVPERIDIVDIFRRREAVPEIVDQAIKVGAKVIWMQEGIVHNEAAEKAIRAGLKVVMNRCMMRDFIALGRCRGEP